MAYRFFICLGLLIALFSPSVAAAYGVEDNDIQMRLASPSSYAAQSLPDLIVEGTWSNSCLPSLVHSRLVDSRIDIQLRSAAAKCVDTPTPFQLKLNPARASGQSQIALGVYEVRLFLQIGNGNTNLVAFRLLRSGADELSSRPESGFWWSVSGPDNSAALAGNGLSIEQQGENLAVTWLSYEAGAPVWYFGSTKMPGAIARIELMRMIGGGEPFSGPNQTPAAEPGISLNLQFDSPSHAQAWLVRPQSPDLRAVDVQTISLQHLPFENGHPGSSWQGQWVLVIGDATEARIIDLSKITTADAESFRVSDRLGSIALQCRLDSIGKNPLPGFCSLTDGAQVIGDFDHVGLDRLSGLTAEGERIRLVRLPK
ncbi:MAG: hypothetical protein ABIR27_03390 [Dokdonella sp.]